MFLIRLILYNPEQQLEYAASHTQKVIFLSYLILNHMTVV